jgi:hypothetical protein
MPIRVSKYMWLSVIEQTDKQTNKQSFKQTNKQSFKVSNKQTKFQTNKHRYTVP